MGQLIDSTAGDQQEAMGPRSTSTQFITNLTYESDTSIISTVIDRPMESSADGGKEASLLLNMPNELLLQICECLCWHCHSTMPTTRFLPERREETEALIHEPTMALAMLSKTCRRVHKLATPILYHGFSAARMCNMYKFLGTILERPDLGRLVKSAFLEQIYYAPHQDCQMDSHDHLIKLALEPLGISKARVSVPIWTIGGEYDVLSQIIIAHLRSLRSLHYEFSAWNTGFGIINQLAEVPGKTGPVNALWPHLQHFTLTDNDSHFGFFDNCAGLFTLAPQVFDLHARYFTSSVLNAAQLKNITHLHLQHANLPDSQTLDRLLCSINCLQVFSFTWTWNTIRGDGLDPMQVVHVLKKYHKDTLKCLKLENWEHYYHLDEGLRGLGLYRLHVLEELRIYGREIFVQYEVWEDGEDLADSTQLEGDGESGDEESDDEESDDQESDDENQLEDIEEPDDKNWFATLPASLRLLHTVTSYTQENERDQLLELAEDAKKPSPDRTLPYLREVNVLSYTREKPENREDYDTIRRRAVLNELRSAFSQTDIAFTASTTGLDADDLYEI